MSTLIVIPARYESSRYPGKPLAKLKGATGVSKSLIQRSWEAACAVSGVDRIVVATDDARICDEVSRFGGSAVMTSSDCVNGTERCSDALTHLDCSFDIIVNLQGDALLTPPWFVEALVRFLDRDKNFGVATPVIRCDRTILDGLLEDRRQGRVGGTTAVFDARGRALYFSKEVVPWVGRLSDDNLPPVFLHIGVYGFKSAALDWYASQESGPLEKVEGLEQLRFLEHGKDVRCIQVNPRNWPIWELNNPSDVPEIERRLAQVGIE